MLTNTAPATARVERRGREALVPLSPPATLDGAGAPLGPVARLFEAWLQGRQATNRIASERTIAGYRDDMARWATLLTPTGPGPAWDRLRPEHLTPDAIAAGLAPMAAAGLSVPALFVRGVCQRGVGFLNHNRRASSRSTACRACSSPPPSVRCLWNRNSSITCQTPTLGATRLGA